MIKCNKIEQEEKDCIITLLQDYNGSWNNLKKEKRYREVIKYYKQKKNILLINKNESQTTRKKGLVEDGETTPSQRV